MEMTPERRSRLLRVAMFLVSCAALLVSMTPSPTDDRIVEMLYRLLEEQRER